MLPPHIVPSQLNIFTPDGTAIIIVASIVQIVSGSAEAGREHVVHPDREAEDADGRRRRR